MKHFYSKLSTWWFATMAPAYGSLSTIQGRETQRKRRHFSVLMLITFIAVFLFALQGIFNGAPATQQIINFAGAGITLIFLWINQRGYLKSASLLHYTTIFFGMAMQMDTLSKGVPILSLFQWAMLLLIPVSAGLFLPVWGPLLVAAIEMGFMLWFDLYARQTQIAILITDPSIRVQFLLFTLTLISIMGIFSAIYALTTTRAVIQADRAVELEQAHQTISHAYATLEVTHQQLETAHATIQKQALTDGLTGLPNHRAIVDQLNKELTHAQRHKRPFSVLFFDGDRFKKVNDTYGHAAGDAVLRQLGERAASVLRGSDTLGRFGGEEFVVLLPAADAQEAAIVAERIRATVAAEPMALSELEGGLAVTVSIGHASYPTDGTSEQDLLRQADEAMYVAKRLGRNQICSAEQARQMSADREMLTLLQQAGQRDAAEREGAISEQLRETSTLRTIASLMALLERRDEAHVQEALAELQREAGVQFDPAIVKAFSALSTNQQAMQVPIQQVGRSL